MAKLEVNEFYCEYWAVLITGIVKHINRFWNILCSVLNHTVPLKCHFSINSCMSYFNKNFIERIITIEKWFSNENVKITLKKWTMRIYTNCCWDSGGCNQNNEVLAERLNSSMVQSRRWIKTYVLRGFLDIYKSNKLIHSIFNYLPTKLKCMPLKTHKNVCVS